MSQSNLDCNGKLDSRNGAYRQCDGNRSWAVNRGDGLGAWFILAISVVAIGLLG